MNQWFLVLKCFTIFIYWGGILDMTNITSKIDIQFWQHFKPKFIYIIDTGLGQKIYANLLNNMWYPLINSQNNI